MKKMARALFGFIFVLGLLMAFQNCSQYKFADAGLDSSSNDVGFDPNNPVLKLSVEGTTVTPDIKVLFVIDNSYTMSQSQDKLALAVDALTEKLLNYNFTAYFVSSSGAPHFDESISPTFSPNSLSVDGQQKNIIINSKLNFRAAAWKEVVVSKSLSNSDRQAKVALIKSNIKSFGTGGIDQEEDFCPIASFFKSGVLKNTTDKVLVVSITDEDDSTNFNNCVLDAATKSYEYKLSAYEIAYKNKYLSAELSEDVLSDGILVPKTRSQFFALPIVNSYVAGQPCSVTDRSSIAQVYKVITCTYSAAVTQVEYIGISEDPAAKCLQIEKDPSVIKGSCAWRAAQRTVSSYPARVNTTIGQVLGLNSSYAASPANWMSVLDRIYPIKNMAFSFIVNDASCGSQLKTGQSVASRLIAAAMSVPEKARVVSPICQNDFSRILESTSNLAIENFSSEFKLPSEVAKISRVSLKNENQVIELKEDEYSILIASDGSKTLKVKTTLSQGDVIFVQY